MEKKFKDAASCWKALLKAPDENRQLLDRISRFARESREPAAITFGTSGWRGEIGTDFTLANVAVVATAVAELLRSSAGIIGARDFDDVQKRGVVVGHDNRFMGEEFASVVTAIMAGAGIRVYYAGEATTPELSACLDMLGAACSVNITASHNPSNYSGVKFNPSDGGPAGSEITGLIEHIANRLMKGGRVPVPASVAEGFERVDPGDLYRSFLIERGTLDLMGIREFVDKEDCLIVVDHVHGATRGRPALLLGNSGKIKTLRTGDDCLFGGIAPEPSAANMKGIMDVISASRAKFRIGTLMDPDGDRIRITDGVRDITMNHFGAMALHYLHRYKNIDGVLVKSVATSNFGNAIAEKLGIPVREQPVGFKHFRPFMLPEAAERAIVSYEESDGISGFNNTLEKDATFGLLLALEMVAATGRNLSEYLADLENEFGRFFPERSGISVDRAMAGQPLLDRLAFIREKCRVGTEIRVGSVTKKIREVITLDGTKMIFEDGSWLLIRPSGTEPKVRFYTETRSEDESLAMAETAARLTREALGA